MQSDSKRQRKRYHKLIDAGLKPIRVWIWADDKEAEKRLKAEDKSGEVK